MPATVTFLQPRTRWCEDTLSRADRLLNQLPESSERRRAVLQVASEIVGQDGDQLVRAASGWLLSELPDDRAEALVMLACMKDLDRTFSR